MKKLLFFAALAATLAFTGCPTSIGMDVPIDPKLLPQVDTSAAYVNPFPIGDIRVR
jgi:hypothetical protein